MIVLASKSPRRKELLARLTSNFIIEVSDVDEKMANRDNPLYLPYELSYLKAKEVSKNHYDDIVIGADTIVIYENQILEKPIDELDALRMLKMLNNKTHKVVSGVAIIYQDKEIRYYEESNVTFNNLSLEEINYYISTKDPLDKAGAYGIQNPYVKLVKTFDGEYENIVGLPLIRLKAELEKLTKL